jgi:Helix-turn-helix domain
LIDWNLPAQKGGANSSDIRTDGRILLRRQARKEGARMEAHTLVESAIKDQGRLAFTISEVVAAGVGSPSSIYQFIAEGKLRAVKRGRSTLILADDLRAFLQSLPPITPGSGKYSKVAHRAGEAFARALARRGGQRKAKKPAPRQRRRRS